MVESSLWEWERGLVGKWTKRALAFSHCADRFFGPLDVCIYPIVDICDCAGKSATAQLRSLHVACLDHCITQVEVCMVGVGTVLAEDRLLGQSTS
jgi:hypothetical protein